METTFNFENFDIKLDTDFIGRNFIYSEEVSSTNSLLLDPKTPAANGTVLLAEKQTKGHGRKERPWYSMKGLNLTFSILLINRNYFKKNFNLINFASSLSTAISIESLYQLKTELKWPNDILINEKKVSGILIESASKGEKIERVVIGTGLNVNQTSFQGNYSVQPTSLKLEINQNIERETLLADLLNIFEETLENVLHNPAWILKEWKERCRMIGEKISVTDGVNTRYGIFDDINENGFLMLRNGKKIEEIFYGDVSIV